MVWKSYPVRKYKEDVTEKAAQSIVDVCSCGHGDFNHTRDNGQRVACEECLCLLFEKQTSMSIHDLVKLDFQRRGIKID